MRKEADVKCKVENAVGRFQLPTVNVNGITQHLKGVKRNSNRQNDIEMMNRLRLKPLDDVDKKIAVLEVSQQTKVHFQTKQLQSVSFPLQTGSENPTCQMIINQSGKNKQQKKKSAALLIKKPTEYG